MQLLLKERVKQSDAKCCKAVQSKRPLATPQGLDHSLSVMTVVVVHVNVTLVVEGMSFFRFGPIFAFFRLPAPLAAYVTSSST